MAEVATRTGVFDDAEFLLETVVELQPEHMDAAYNLALILQERRGEPALRAQRDGRVGVRDERGRGRAARRRGQRRRGAARAVVGFDDTLREGAPSEHALSPTRVVADT